MNDLCTLDNNLNENMSDPEPWDYNHKKSDLLESVVYEALIFFSCSRAIGGWTADTHALLRKEHKIWGLQFAEAKVGAKNTIGRHSIVFFQPATGGQLVPGVIKFFFSMPLKWNGIETQAFLVIHLYRPLSEADVIEVLQNCRTIPECSKISWIDTSGNDATND